MLGVYGGTFNPVHYGHLRTGLEVMELFGLERLYWVPCRMPPHRNEPDVSAEMRLAMLKLSIADMPGMYADRRELDRDGPSYMVDTLRSFREEAGDAPILLFLGADAFAGLQRWHQWRQLFQYAHLVVMTRPGYKRQKLSDFFQQRLVEDPIRLPSRPAGGLYFQDVTLLDISATQIRKIISAGRSPQFLLPDAVLGFMREHRLYQAAPLITGP